MEITRPGYGGAILYVDLTSGDIRKEPLDAGMAQQFIGGHGLASRLAYSYIKPEIKALAPESPIIISPGFLNGTTAPGTPKIMAMAKCPLTGAISFGSGSGYFGPMLKWAGYDVVIITGRAEKPSYISIMDDEVEICDAREIWGKDVFDTHEELRRKHGDGCSTFCTGEAGENLARIALAFTDGYITCGRSLGANMGSKNLKAIVAYGTKGISLADPRRFMKAADLLIERAMGDKLRDNWIRLGVLHVLPVWLGAGHRIWKHGTETVPVDRMLKVYGADEFVKTKRKTLSCTSCITCDKATIGPIGDTSIDEKPFSTPLNLALYSMEIGIEDQNKSIKFHDFMNRRGIDSVSFCDQYDFLIELFDRGILTTKDTGGLDFKFGDYDTIMKLAELTARMEGFGKTMAGGFPEIIKHIDKEAGELAYQVKGIAPDWDARASLGVETFGLVVNPRPAYDMPIGGLTAAKGRKPDFFRKVANIQGFPPDRIDDIVSDTGFNLGRFTAHYDDWGYVLNTFGVCFRMQVASLYSAKILSELYSAATGIEKSTEDIVRAGERALNIYKAINVKEGFTRKDDAFPKRWFTPLKHAEEELVLRDYTTNEPVTEQDLEKMLDSYYDEKGWDIKTGIPTRQKLTELGLDYVAKDLEKSNLL